MNDLNLPPPEDLSAQIAALRRQVLTLLLALIVVSGTLTVFLYRQARLAGSDLAQINLVINNFNQNRPALDNFVNQLAVYGSKNPDFAQQVLKKYGIVPPPPAAPAAPAPAPPKK
jgi:hypothetical protein